MSTWEDFNNLDHYSLKKKISFQPINKRKMGNFPTNAIIQTKSNIVRFCNRSERSLFITVTGTEVRLIESHGTSSLSNTLRVDGPTVGTIQGEVGSSRETFVKYEWPPIIQTGELLVRPNSSEDFLFPHTGNKIKYLTIRDAETPSKLYVTNNPTERRFIFFRDDFQMGSSGDVIKAGDKIMLFHRHREMYLSRFEKSNYPCAQVSNIKEVFTLHLCEDRQQGAPLKDSDTIYIRAQTKFSDKYCDHNYMFISTFGGVYFTKRNDDKAKHGWVLGKVANAMNSSDEFIREGDTITLQPNKYRNQYLGTRLQKNITELNSYERLASNEDYIQWIILEGTSNANLNCYSSKN